MSKQSESPRSLGHLAADRLGRLLAKAMTKMNKMFAADLRKNEDGSTKPNSNNNNMDNNNARNINEGEGSQQMLAVNPAAGAKASAMLIKIRRYLMTTHPSATKTAFTPEVIHQIIAIAIEKRNLGLIRLILCEWHTHLDFRALRYSGDSRYTKKVGEHVAPRPKHYPVSSYFLPPEEFDCFAQDRMGHIITMLEGCELFSIIGMSLCAPGLKELYINARRVDYWAAPPAAMEVAANVLQGMKSLTVLHLRGMCDDYMLKLIGKNATGLKHLDIKGSHFVTDAGIKNLFFSDIKENPALYIMKSFIEKNLNNMNPLVHTLETLDYSWTNVTGLARKMVQHIPGAFMFKRNFAQRENYSYGHHVFIRKPQLIYSGKVPTASATKSKDGNLTKFESALQASLNVKAGRILMKFMEQHPWKNCNFFLYDGDKSGRVHGILTANEEEKRVYGTVTFQDANLTELHSVFPVNLNILGDACPKLHAFRGILTDTWKLKSSVLTELSTLDIFADPLTTKSILEFAPNLRKVRIRIQRERLTDNIFGRDFSTFMCCRTLEELWISSGTFISDGNAITERPDSDSPEAQLQSFNEVLANYYCDEHPPRSQGMTPCILADLVQLTSNFMWNLLTACKHLRRIGDLAFWTQVPQSEVDRLDKEMKAKKREVFFIWENKMYPRIK